MDTVLGIALEKGNYFTDGVLEQALRQGLLTGRDIEHLATLVVEQGRLRVVPDPDAEPEPQSLAHADSGWEGFYTTNCYIQPDDNDASLCQEGQF